MLRCLLLCLVLVFSMGVLLADGMLIPEPGFPRFSISYQKVMVTIKGQTATTVIDQSFHNNADSSIEGTYIFPIPAGANISKFSLRADEEKLVSHILEGDEARRAFTGIVSRQRDPALLEWLGDRIFQVRILAIPANGDKRVRITYHEVLSSQNGVIKYLYPLKAAKLSKRPLQDCQVKITITNPQPIHSIYSPSHNLTIHREGKTKAIASYREKGVLPDQDLLLYYTVSKKDLGMNLLTYSDPDKGDGYFLLLASPNSVLSETAIQAKDIVFVLDTSGSMRNNNKLQQAKAALSYCLKKLDPRDRFSVLTFNTQVHAWQSTLQSASPAHISEAAAFFASSTASKNTNIDEALRQATELLNADHGAARVRNILFLTDGLPTEGVTDVDTILANMRERNTQKARVFDFGVGYDYNTHFLDQLASQNKGQAENVLPQDNLQEKISSLYDNIASPLLSDLKLDFGGAKVYDQYPKELPDIYQGTQLVVVGRYTPESAGSVNISLSGMTSDAIKTISTTATFPARAQVDDFIPRLWATRKIGFMEDQMRLTGGDQRLLAQIIELSKEFGIITEYSSFLADMDYTSSVPRPMALARSPESLARANLYPVRGLASKSVGGSAVNQAINRKMAMNSMQYAPINGNAVYDARGQRVVYGQMRYISRRSFVQNGSQWVDVYYQLKQRILTVKDFSPAYFQLANAHPNMAQYMSLGENVMVSLKDEVIQFGASGQEKAFTPRELKRLKKEMINTFGEPPVIPLAKAGSVMLPPWYNHLSLWAWALCALLLFSAALLLLRQVKKMKKVSDDTPVC